MAPSYKSARADVRIHRRSDLGSHHRCPERFDEEKRLGPGAIQNRDALDRGTWFHAAVEAMLEPMKGNPLGIPDPVNASQVIHECPDHLVHEVTDLVRKWIQRWPITHVIDVERLLTSEVLTANESPDGKSHHVGGRLDLITHPSIVWDWKTSWVVPSVETMLDDLQVGSYALLASDHFGWTEVDVAVDFVRWGVTRHVAFDMEAIQAAVIKLKQYILDLLAWEAEPESERVGKRPGAHCAGCPLLVRCDVAHPNPVRGVTDAVDLGSVILHDEHRTPAMRETMRDYLATLPTKSLDVGDKVFELALEGSHKVEDVQALGQLLVDHGHDPWPYLSVDQEKLNRFVEKNPGLRGDVNALRVDRRTTRLKIRNR